MRRWPLLLLLATGSFIHLLVVVGCGPANDAPQVRLLHTLQGRRLSLAVFFQSAVTLNQSIRYG